MIAFEATFSRLIVFDWIGYTYHMYQASVALEKFGLRTLLCPLPLGTFFGRPQQCDISYEGLTYPQWQFGVFLSAYPEKITLPTLPPAPDEKGSESDLLETVYGIASKINQYDFACSFERFIRSDRRLEAADLERFRDSFAQDDYFTAAEPDWFKTTSDNVALLPTPPLLPIKSLADCAQTITTMIFRDGFFVIPFKEDFGLTEQGMLYLLRAPMTIRLSAAERKFINAFYPAFLSENFSTATKALLISNFIPPYFSPMSLQDLLSSSTDLLSDLTKAGIDPPLRIRYVMQIFQRIRPTTAEMELYADTTVCDDLTPDDITNFVAMPDSFAQMMEVRGKKSPTFVEDPSQVSDLLKRHEMGEQYRPKKAPLWGILFLMLGIFVALYVLGIL